MSWLSSGFLWAAGLAIPLVILYLRRVRHDRALVPSLVFWDAALERTEATSLFRKLRRLLSLLLMLVILAALVLAAARPQRTSGELAPTLYVVVLDVSASMRATDETGSSAESRALALARRTLTGIRSPDLGALVTGVSGGELVVAPTSDHRRLLAALDETRAGEVPGTLEGALGIARELCRAESARTGEHGQPVVVLLSDLAGRDSLWAQQPPELAGGRLVIAPVGRSVPNVTLSGVGARRNSTRAASALTFTASTSSAAGDYEARVWIDGALGRVLPLTLAPGTAVSRELELDLDRGGLVRVDLVAAGSGVSPDSFTLDDVGRAVLTPPRRARVAVLAPRSDGDQQAFFMLAALESMPDLVDLGESIVAFADEVDAETLAAFDVIICDGAFPESLPVGCGVLSCGVAGEGWPASARALTAAPVELPIVDRWDRDHPVMSFVGLEDVVITRASPFALAVSGTPLVEGPRGVLVAAFDQARGRGVHTGFRFEDSDAVFRVAFPLLLRNAVLWLSPRARHLVPQEARAGEPIVALHALPDGVERVDVSRLGIGSEPDEEVSLQTRASRFVFDGTDRAGFYRFRAGRELDFSAVDFEDERESNLDPALTATWEELEARVPAPARSQLWPGLAWLALVLLALEWVLHAWRLTE